MDKPSVFYVISKAAAEKGIPYILIGGFAVNYYKVTRQTADVDFLITRDGFEKIAHVLEQAGYKRDSIQENFAQLKSTDPFLWDMDFMFVDEDTLEKILRESREIEIAKEKFLVPSLEHLIALKLHSIKYNPKLRQSKDLPDIIDLIRINGFNYKDAEFKALCLKFGNEDIYKDVIEALNE